MHSPYTVHSPYTHIGLYTRVYARIQARTAYIACTRICSLAHIGPYSLYTVYSQYGPIPARARTDPDAVPRYLAYIRAWAWACIWPILAIWGLGRIQAIYRIWATMHIAVYPVYGLCTVYGHVHIRYTGCIQGYTGIGLYTVYPYIGP